MKRIDKGANAKAVGTVPEVNAWQS
jgi:hypothetical protein